MKGSILVLLRRHEEFILGHHINTGIEMDRNSTNEGCKTDREEDRMEYRRGQENVTMNADSFEDKAVDKEGSETPRNQPIMVTVRVPIDMVDRETFAAMSPSTNTCITNNGKTRGDTELLGIIQERMHSEPERRGLEIAATQLNEGKNTNGTGNRYRQTDVNERSEEHLVVER